MYKCPEMTAKTHIFLVIACCTFFSATSCLSQNFQRCYGTSTNEIGTCIQNTPDGNYIISARNENATNGNGDFGLLKINSSGSILWSKSYGGTNTEKNSYVSVCSDGGFILTGYTVKPGSGNFMDLLLLKADSDGNLSWSASIGSSKDDQGWYVTEANDGGFLAVGSSKSFNAPGNWDGYIVKVNSAGTLQWTKVMGGTGSDYFLGMSKTNDGGYIISGETLSNTFGSSDMWLVKINSDGDTLWTRQFGKITEDGANTVVQTADGGYIIAGDIHTSPGAGDHNAALLKTDSGGNLQWAKTYGSSPGGEIGWAVRQTQDKGYFLMGSSNFYGNGGGGDFMLVKTSSDGNLQWAKAYGGSLFDDVWYFHQSVQNGNMMVGSTQSFGAGQQDIYLVSMDSVGISECYTTSILPLVNTPVLQTRSGTNVITGGIGNTVSILSSVPQTLSYDPCAFVGVEENKESNSDVLVYPNPFSEMTSIHYLKTIGQNFNFRLFNVFGQEAHPVILRTSEGLIIYREGLSGGAYFYILESSGEMHATGKIMIQ